MFKNTLQLPEERLGFKRKQYCVPKYVKRKVTTLNQSHWDSLSSTIDTTASKFPPVEIIVFGDLNVRNKDWLGFDCPDSLPSFHG